MSLAIPEGQVIRMQPRSVQPAGQLITVAERWLSWKQASGLSPRTITAYRSDLNQFIGFCRDSDVHSVQHVDRQLVEEFLVALQQGEGNSDRTRARKLESIRGLLGYARENGLIKRDFVGGMRIRFQAAPPAAVEYPVLRRVIDAIDTDSWIGRRDRALLMLIYDACLRLSEPLRLDVHVPECPPVNGIRNECVVLQVKGGRMDMKAISNQETLQALREWEMARENHPKAHKSSALFIGPGGQRLSRAAVHYRIKKWGAAAGLPNAHGHMFRHSRVAEVYSATGDVRLAQQMAGHSDPATTMRLYGHQSPEQMRHAIRSQAPLGCSAEEGA